MLTYDVDIQWGCDEPTILLMAMDTTADLFAGVFVTASGSVTVIVGFMYDGGAFSDELCRFKLDLARS